MKKKPHKKPEAKPETPLTFLEAVRKNNWGQGDRAMHPEPGKDRYFVTAGGEVDDKNWEPGPDDWALFSEMMRDRVNSMREPKEGASRRPQSKKQRAPKLQLAGELTHEQRCSLGQAPGPQTSQPSHHQQPAGIGADRESIGA